MSSYHLDIKQQAILCPYKDLREYSDDSPPLSYSVDIAGQYYYQWIEQPMFVAAGIGAVPMHYNSVLATPGYASVRDFKVSLDLKEDANVPGITNSEGQFCFDVFYGDITDRNSWVYVATRYFRCMPGQKVEVDMPDIERVQIPADMNMFWTIYLKAGYEFTDVQGSLNVHYICVLDDK